MDGDEQFIVSFMCLFKNNNMCKNRLRYIKYNNLEAIYLNASVCIGNVYTASVEIVLV